jgi:chromosome segregation ATPase
MNLLELLHNEKVVKTLEQIDSDLKDLTEPSSNDKSIFLKIILIVETLFLFNRGNTSNIGRYFSRWYDKQSTIDDINEDIKMKKVKRDDIKFRLEDLEVEKEKLEYRLQEINAEIDTKQWEPQKIDDEIENLKWEPTRLQDWIEEASFPIDSGGLEGFIFEKLKEELIYNKKLNYNYGKEDRNTEE